MLMAIQDAVLQLLPAKRKLSNKWITFNAPCCVHNGESADTRSRGGVITSPDGGVSYHCFNCNYKTGWKPGRPMGYRFRKLLDWMGAGDNTVQRLMVEALRLRDIISPVSADPAQPKKKIEFKARPLPDNSASFTEWSTMLRLTDDDYVVPEQLGKAVEYVSRRNVDLNKYEFYITDTSSHNLDKRVIIPFTWNKEIIGYTARATVDDVKPRYHNSHEPGYVFNVDNQLADSKFVIVMEGPFDAMSVDGIAILGSDISDEQADIIDSLGRDVIVVPDFDVHYDKKGKKQWPGRSLIDAALDNNWHVSFPIWHEQYKDASAATAACGKLFVLKTILDARETSALKIELITKRLYNTLQGNKHE